MHSRRVITLAGAAVAAGTALATAAPPALAHHGHTPHVSVVSSQVGAPFNIDVHGHRVLVADGGINAILALKRDGSTATVVPDVTGASGIARTRHALAFTETEGDESGITASSLHIRPWRGREVVADTLAYERAHNPDQHVGYGIKNATQCQKDALAAVGFPAEYNGLVDSHAYSVAAYRGGWLVADAGGNDLLRVNRHGRIRTVAVFPAQPSVITQAEADSVGLPSCVVGATYRFESVPTDVEVGRHGQLYVSLLPGGPEDPSFGARGSVYSVDARTGHTHRIAGGLAGATNVAVGRHGTLYVAELFSGVIAAIRHGHVSTYVDLPGAVAVESGRHGSLWAATIDLSGAGPGSVVRIR